MEIVNKGSMEGDGGNCDAFLACEGLSCGRYIASKDAQDAN